MNLKGYLLFILLSVIIEGCTKDEIPSAFIKDVEGNSYETVIIGDQIWMAENLRTTKYNDGTPIEYVEDWNIEKGRYCWYDHDEKNKKPHGALYNWYAVNTGKLAPAGWRIPTFEDWEELQKYLGGEIIAGGKIKKRSSGIWEEPNKLVEPDCEFNAYPSGGIYTGNFVELGKETKWWTSSIFDTGKEFSLYFTIINEKTDLWAGVGTWNFFISVRCIKVPHCWAI